MSVKREKAHVKAQKAGRKRDHNTCQICGTKLNPEGHSHHRQKIQRCPDS